MLERICAPALLYIAFSITHVIIDTVKGLYNTAMTKFLIMIVFSGLLNLLCESGMSIVSWIVVFIPFITMSIITTIVLISFGLSPASGKLKYDDNDNGKSRKIVVRMSDKDKDKDEDEDEDKEPTEYNEFDDNYETVYQTEAHTHTHNGQPNSYTI